MKNKAIFCLIALVLMLPIVYGLTASIGNARMIIHTTVEEGETTTIEKSIKINNVNDVPVKITLEPRGDLIDIIDLKEKSFELQPGESKEAQFTVELEYGGTYQGQVGVGFQSLEGGSGVGLSSTIIIIAEGPEDPNRKQPTNATAEETPEETPTTEETPEEEPEDSNVTFTLGGKKGQFEETKAASQEGKKANPLVGILIILIIVVVGVIIALGIMIMKRKK